MKLIGILQSGAVLQRDREITIKGYEAAGTIAIAVGNEKYLGKADENGDFSVKIPPRKGSFEPVRISVSDEKETVAIDVKFGDVYLAMGQSNMSYNVGCMINADEILQRAKTADVSFFNVFEADQKENGEIYRPAKPQKDFSGKWKWVTGKDDAFRESSGVAAMCALKLSETASVPIGVVCNSLGGVSIDTYLPRAAVENSPAVKRFLKKTGKYIAETDPYNVYGGGNYTQTCGLFNEKVAPITFYSFAAILWYQGENSVNGFDSGTYYKHALTALIKSYSEIFGKIPFVCTHIALDYYPYGPYGYNYINEAIDIACGKFPFAYSFPAYDASTEWLKLSGDLFYHPIHPVDKRLIASRFAEVLKTVVYDKKPFVAPYIAKTKICGGKIIATVTPAGTRLKKGYIKGFAVAGKDRKFIQAEAKVIGKNTVEIFSPYIAEPTETTYAFSCVNDMCNLKTTSGFAVKPYREEFEDVKKAAYFRLNVFGDCDEKFATEKCFGPDLGCIGKRKAWDGGTISATNVVRISFVRGDEKKIMKVDFAPTNEGYYYFGVSPNVCIGGYDAHFDRFARITMRMKTDADVEFHGILIRQSNGEIHRLIGDEMSVKMSGEWKDYTVNADMLVEGDLGRKKATPEIMKNVCEAEIMFRSKSAGTLYIDKVRFHD